MLAAVLALLAVGTLAHVLLTSVRRRRRDLAVLKTLGLVRSQVLRVVAWEASALVGAALLVGLPLGILAGRWAWAIFAGSAGVSGAADVPVALVLAAVPVTLVLASLIAAEVCLAPPICCCLHTGDHARACETTGWWIFTPQIPAAPSMCSSRTTTLSCAREYARSSSATLT
ncbi:MAG TPA: FtsX-like permease family protein [Streptosporangiaceae bacterium]|nr:FtsX-like permease family protein [Streptosporangiaceae bacterium]